MKDLVSPCNGVGWSEMQIPIRLRSHGKPGQAGQALGSPDFLWNLVALANFMRLSLRKGAPVVLSSAAQQEIRVRSEVVTFLSGWQFFLGTPTDQSMTLSSRPERSEVESLPCLPRLAVGAKSNGDLLFPQPASDPQ
jgi:hypothetical protein